PHESYTLSLHDALPICLGECEYFEALVQCAEPAREQHHGIRLFHEQQLAREEVFEMHELVAIAGDNGVGVLLERQQDVDADAVLDRKSTRLNSSHGSIS